ncbi:hypothetical protein EJD96_16200 [Herbaspirillum seropedicae]|uniref:hypothetical protein n=1 Tax=Herbaspirillum seropedicae TaxID=964 RepID=UPI00111D5E46|nr:hypothetical protein [Herbaspirillum seropedicae]QDD65591.1 hypothetical protein EJD96_16200 [Herbaspirillum seropedicae]
MNIPSGLEPWSWVAGIVGTGIAAVALAIQITQWKKKKKKNSERSPSHSIRQTAGNSSVQIGSVSGSNTITNNVNHNYMPAPPSRAVDIPGRWSIEDAKRICHKHLGQADWKLLAPDLEDPLNHDFVGSFFQTYKIKEEFVLIFSTITVDMDCHACAPYLSFFEFVKEDAGWDLKIYDIAAYKAGSWGKPPDLSIKVIGDEKYAVFMEDSYMAQGWTVTGTSIHARIGDSFKEICNLLTSQGDPDGNGWTGRLSLIPTNTGFYDIEVRREGIPGPENLVFLDSAHDFKADVADYDGKVRAADTFKFDGQRYRRESPISSYR